MDKDMSDPFIDSLCLTCKHCVNRVIEPIDLESFIQDYGYLGVDDFEEGDELLFGQITCMLLHIDLDHVVLECNKYEPESMSSLLEHELIKRWSL
ncbi:hypothetical protein DRQ25_01655 [Candidatus Fermentibacteria bacterium]|nr:MAG: hypothetical protein DRQ25_01655 [Candidatus Fermentibacteria bacterium]